MVSIVARPGLISSRNPGLCKRNAQELKAVRLAHENIERGLDAPQDKAGRAEMLGI